MTEAMPFLRKLITFLWPPAPPGDFYCLSTKAGETGFAILHTFVLHRP